MTIYYVKKRIDVTYRQNERLALLFAFLSISIGALLIVFNPGAAHAATAGATAAPDWTSCPNLKAWYVNEDETARTPVPGAAGLSFSGDQLVHHAVSMDLKDVHPGAYAAAPAASLDDFFSIEVANPSAPVHYGTLRYEATGAHAGTWNIGGTSLYSPVDPTGAELEKFAADNNRSTNVVSLGVGYVATPATGTETVVSAVTFHGKTYDLTCKPSVIPSQTPKPSTSASSPHHVPQTPAPALGGPNGTSTGALAITGPSGFKLGIVAGALLAVGAGTFVLTRRRNRKFVA